MEDKTGYVLKSKEGTPFEGCYISAGNCFTSKIRSAIIYHDDIYAKHCAKKMEEFDTPYEGYKKDNLEIVPVIIQEADSIPEASFLWHCSDQAIDYREILTGEDKFGVADTANAAAALGFRLALRKLEDMGIIQMSDIDRSPEEKDKKIWDKNFPED